LRELPEAVLVVVLQTENDAVLPGHRQHGVDALDNPREPLFPAHAGVPLTAENAAHRTGTTEPASEADHLGYEIAGTLAGMRFGVREVRRTAEHRHDEAGLVDRLADGIEVDGFEAGEEPLEHFEPVGVELFGHLDPVEDGHAAASDLFEVALRKRGE